MSKVEGSFVPPAMGNSSVPLNISGPGSIEMTDTHLNVSGFASSFALNSGLIALLVFGLILGSGWIKMTFFPNLDGEYFTYAMVFVLGTIIMWAVKGSKKHNADKPMELSIPWENIQKVNIESKGDEHSSKVLIFTRKFKPKGTLYFEPSDCSSKELESMINQALQNHTF